MKAENFVGCVSMYVAVLLVLFVVLESTIGFIMDSIPVPKIIVILFYFWAGFALPWITLMIVKLFIR